MMQDGVNIRDLQARSLKLKPVNVTYVAREIALKILESCSFSERTFPRIMRSGFQLLRANGYRGKRSCMQPRLFASSSAEQQRANQKQAYNNRMTKVICTLGPSSDSTEMVHRFVGHGMDVARLNFSHVNIKDFSAPLDKLEKLRSAGGMHERMGWNTEASNLRAILVDTKGPEIRTGPLAGNAETLDIPEGNDVILTLDDVTGDDPSGPIRLNIDYTAIATTLKVGGSVLLDDGLIELEVKELFPDDKQVRCVAVNGGPIKRNKGVNLPGTVVDLPALTQHDKTVIRWAVEHEADYIAASFIRSAANVRSCIAFIDRCLDERYARNPQIPRRRRPMVISKIESEEGVHHFDEILKASDGIMVARGDLGVEIPFETVFRVQRNMVEACNRAGKPVIIATQMLDSMIVKPRPTRAEVTDVGTAVLEGADAVMLSGETAAGKYPMQSLEAMLSIVREADSIAKQQMRDDKARRIKLIEGAPQLKEPRDVELHAVAESAVNSALSLGVKAIILLTRSGTTARTIARYRPTVPVFAFCFDPAVARSLQLHRGIFPILHQLDDSVGEGQPRKQSRLRKEAVRTVIEMGVIKVGDRVVTVDQAIGRETDAFKFGANLKIFTVTEA